MREIKFRFWSNYLKNFVVPDDTIFIGALKDPDMKPMQFTGLKDPHGVEIYEGDIVRFEIHMENYSTQGGEGDLIDHVLGQVIINARGVQVAIPNGKYQRDIMDAGDWQTPPDYSHSVPLKNAKWPLSKSRTTVIGNIYENPELLETKS
jgi:uncharacterized phage protein (TIGR01671 family)